MPAQPNTSDAPVARVPRDSDDTNAPSVDQPRFLRLLRTWLSKGPNDTKEPTSPQTSYGGESDAESDLLESVLFRAETSPPPSPFQLSISKEGASARKSLELYFSQPGVPNTSMREGLVFPKEGTAFPKSDSKSL